jgi:hypothetical protein
LEDTIVLLVEEKAIECSIMYPNSRVEIFSDETGFYKPTYNFYKNGALYTPMKI